MEMLKKSSQIKMVALSICLSMVISIGVSILVLHLLVPHIAYVDTGKLMVGFSEANLMEKELKEESKKWTDKLKVLQDSLQSQMDRMTKEYNDAPAAKKKELQDMLSARNQQVNNFRQANIKKMNELRQKKMQTVIEKANVFMSEYGKNHKYSLILGTAAGGSILYGDEQKYDITDEIIKGLNERYK